MQQLSRQVGMHDSPGKSGTPMMTTDDQGRATVTCQVNLQKYFFQISVFIYCLFFLFHLFISLFNFIYLYLYIFILLITGLRCPNQPQHVVSDRPCQGASGLQTAQMWILQFPSFCHVQDSPPQRARPSGQVRQGVLPSYQWHWQSGQGHEEEVLRCPRFINRMGSVSFFLFFSFFFCILWVVTIRVTCKNCTVETPNGETTVPSFSYVLLTVQVTHETRLLRCSCHLSF